ncbi:PAS domain-containing hybrid sensor histidine kinase/response regulator [Oceanibium sediminis]|uniref:PAS domain-containing hybrid sensor histidine kinase/response regulator n=1 Tax=Oceanibium sediminis TaxID=2026339 RepID=UPI000DD3A228|nr:PAS domain S-box protein [Oceanibium sediminis]
MARSISVIYVTSVELDHIVMTGILQKKWSQAKVKRVHTAESLEKALHEASWDAILFHESGSGLKLEDVLRVRGESVQKPAFIFLSDAAEIERTREKHVSGDYSVVSFNNTDALIKTIYDLEISRTVTKKTAVEKSSETYERQFKSLIEISADTLLVVRPDGTLVFANPAASELFGRPIEELVGRNFGVTGTTTAPMDVEIVRPKGDRLMAEIRGSKVYWDGEDCQLVSLRDVTRRREMEVALEESEARYSALLANAGDGIVTFNEFGVIEDFNGAAELIFGWKREEIVGREIGELFDQDLMDKLPVSGDAAGGKGTTPPARPRAVECTGKNRLGHALALEIAVSHFLFRGRQSFIGSIRDISERKKMMRDLQASEERFRTAFSSAPDAIALTDLEGNILQVNPELCRLTGFSERELLRSNLAAVIHPEDRTSEEGKKTALISGKQETIERELRFVRKGGGEFLCLARCGLIRGSNRAPIQIVEHFRDITEKRNMEMQLRQSQKMEAIGQLTGGVAHDFNNLLGIVIGNLDLLQEELAGNTLAAHYADTALDASLRGAELNKQMLAFARRQPLAASTVDVGAMLRDMSGMIQRLVGERITVMIDVVGDCGPSKIDATQLQSAIMNLALNARDAMPSGGSLSIEAEHVVIDDTTGGPSRDRAPGNYTMITVADTGQGIDPAVLDRVFEPFFTTKEVGKGTGLGLSMVFGFIKQSGGHIAIDSELGQGTAVHVYLPSVDMKELENENGATSGAAPKGLGHTILLVEDNDRLREMATKQLEKLNYTVIDACDAASAMKIIERKDPIDLLFTDIVMPGPMDGVELSEAARAVRPNLPVLFASGFSDPSVIGGISPTDIFLRKPYRRTELAAAVSSALKDERYARA